MATRASAPEDGSKRGKVSGTGALQADDSGNNPEREPKGVDVKNNGQVAQQATWCRRWATRAADALALWGAIKSGAADTMPVAGYLTPGSVDELLAGPCGTRRRPPKRTAVTKVQRASCGRDVLALGLAPLASWGTTSAGTLTLGGAPTKAGVYTLSVTASNSSGEAKQTFVLTVPNRPLDRLRCEGPRQ
jgi:hypothetical protein